jgi:hypothetical protein
MVKAVVLYGPPEDPDAFERYYADTHTALAQNIPGPQRFEAARGFRRRTAARSPTSASPSSRSRTWTRFGRASDPRRGRRPSTTSRTSPPAASRSSSPRSTDPSARRSRSAVTAFRRRARRLALKAWPEGRAVDRPSTGSATRTSRGPGEGGNTGGWVNGPLYGRDRRSASQSAALGVHELRADRVRRTSAPKPFS